MVSKSVFGAVLLGERVYADAVTVLLAAAAMSFKLSVGVVP